MNHNTNDNHMNHKKTTGTSSSNSNSNSNSKTNNRRRTTKQEQQQQQQQQQQHDNTVRRHNGIADYFAILGIGDNLQVKATAQQTKQHPNNNNDNDNNDNYNDKEKEKEEQCQMMQRFYREIVHVGILSVYTGTLLVEDSVVGGTHVGGEHSHGVGSGSSGGGSSSGGTIYAAHLASSCSVKNHTEEEEEKDNDDDADERKHHGVVVDEKKKTLVAKSVPVPPVPVQVPPLIPLQTRPGMGSEYDTIDGFQIMYHTVPASDPSSYSYSSSQYHHHHHLQQTRDHESSFQGRHDVSLNLSSLSMNTTFDGGIGGGGSSSKDNHDDDHHHDALWSKGQTFLANLHPLEGYRATLLSHNMLSSSTTAAAAAAVSLLSDDSLLLDNYINPMDNNNAQQYKKDCVVEENNGGKISNGKFFSKLGLTRPLAISKFRQTILSSPILYNHDRNDSKYCTHDDDDDDDEKDHVDCLFVDENERGLHSGDGGGKFVMSTTELLDQKQKHSATGKVSVPILKKEFYIGYRRRDPDEAHVPGIADCKIVYCRIHKDSVLPEKKDLRKRLRIIHNGVRDDGGGGAGSGSGSGGYNHEVKVRSVSQKRGVREKDTKSMQMKNNNGPNQKTTVAVMKKSLLATAEIAKNVVSHGRDKLRMAVGPGMNDDTPTFPTRCETGNEVTHGNVDNRSFRLDIDKEEQQRGSRFYSHSAFDVVNLDDLLDIPEGYDEWVIPELYQQIRLPVPPSPSNYSSPRNYTSSCVELNETSGKLSEQQKQHYQVQGESAGENRMQKTFLFSSSESPSTDNAGIGIETYVDGSTFLNTSPKCYQTSLGKSQRNPWSPVERVPFQDERVPSKYDNDLDRGAMLPQIIEADSLPSSSDVIGNCCINYEYVPLLVLRRQRIRNEERFREDPSIVDLGITFIGFRGEPVSPVQDEEDLGDDENNENPILGMSPWTSEGIFRNWLSKNVGLKDEYTEHDDGSVFGTPYIIMRRNVPLGFLDTPFATSVLDRFPKKDYKGLPLPEEELPMFCYPTGCRLIRSKYQDAPLPEHYGFVVKNERGDSIYVSCVSFVESLTPSKQHQLNEISKSRILTSLPHKAYWEEQGKIRNNHTDDEGRSLVVPYEVGNGKHIQDGQFLTGFDDVMTFEYKTICIISRYPFWCAFRRFLSHLHILSGSSSDIPLERYISHLMLSVPVPKPGGQCILVPLPAVASPMVIGLPPLKDFPVLDLSFRRLFSCLDVPTVVTIVLGFLALERKVIVMSTYPSLVSDACELLKSLLFPFELCAPYVPRLTEPFMSCLEFPGAIFAGIHDDGSEDGLAASVRRSIPDDTFIVDLDTGDIDCNGERFDILKECWEIIPCNARSSLVEEIETLCQDVNLVPGQEPPGSELEAALDTADVSFAPIFGEEDILQLDDRAIRDAFLRLFCFLLGDYERFLLVPDIDFVVSGNEWFDTKGFLSSVENQSRSAYLHSFVSTQLFQLFIQRRTEASDVHCLLFDECLSEYHSSQEAFGRLTNVLGPSDAKGFTPRYELLVDRCAAEFSCVQELDESSSAETSILTAHTTEGLLINNSGDLVTVPSKRNLPPGHRYVYCIDGQPHFPEEMDVEMFYPKEPDVLSAEFGNAPVPILIRSDREIEVSTRRKKLSASRRGVHRQRRCLFQLPKLMGSHVLNSWLMCIPFQVTQNFRSLDQQNIYLGRALGALRLMRSRHRIVPDEAGYRCLIIACGRVQSDRRQDVAKLFGLLRSDGIFPSAVTLGQYTRSIAEGYSKYVNGKTIGESYQSPGFSWSDDIDERVRNFHMPNALDFLDRNILILDKIGSRWRKGREMRQVTPSDPLHNQYSKRTIASRDNSSKTMLRYEQDWMPVSCSSSFSPHWMPPDQIDDTFDLVRDFRFIALWSRTTTCESCQHELLDEEIQAGWDEDSDDDNDTSAKLNCPCCGAVVHPRLGYIEMTPCTQDILKAKNKSTMQVNSNLPAQIRSNIHGMEDDSNDERLGYVPYLSPSKMRVILEQIIDDFGENILDREKLRYLNPTLFFNLWWFCCRFSLPLPLAISNACSETDLDAGAPIYNNHCCAFAAWDKSTAIAACKSASKAVFSLQNTIKKNHRPIATPEFKKLVKSFQNHKINGMEADHCDTGENSRNNYSMLKEEYPLLATLNFHSLGRCDWDNDYLSEILVKLVEACDKRDLYPALLAVLQCNQDRCSKVEGGYETIEFDCYRTLLYLSRYQCTSAFHKFFPTTTKTCKGYHFWCPNATVSIFDRLFREAMERLRAEGNLATVHDISDVALGFRSVFGHII